MALGGLPQKGVGLLRHLKSLLFGPVSGIRREDALKIFRRDHFKCQYCGLDGLQNFENWLILTIDHFHPQARGGPRVVTNLVTACQPCNKIKGRRVFKSREEARKYILAQREHWRHYYLRQVQALRGGSEHQAAPKASARGAG